MHEAEILHDSIRPSVKSFLHNLYCEKLLVTNDILQPFYVNIIQIL